MTTNQLESLYPPAFVALGLHKPLLKALHSLSWTEPSEVQTRLIPPALAGHDILGQARTGTGKTAAFGLPILQQLEHADGVRCLILAPTRELAAQVADEMGRLAKFTEHKIMVAYGGTRVKRQASELKHNPAIVVGTPGRIMDLMGRGLLKLDHIKFAVLDEVDRMLDIGFRDDIRKILGGITHPHQTILVSATISDEINLLSRKYMHNPLEVFCAPDKLTVDEVQQFYLSVESMDKARLLLALLEKEKPELAIVFARTKREVTRLTKKLTDAGINACEIHGDLYQGKRDRVMKRFRKGHIGVLVATDLASRGLDVSDISHIINYDIPEDPEVYVHRIGRTARMGETGKAFTFVTREQGPLLTAVEMLINREVPAMALDGFQASPPRPSEHKAPAQPVVSRAQAPVFGQDQPPVRKTLGSKFRPIRRRRL